MDIVITLLIIISQFNAGKYNKKKSHYFPLNIKKKVRTYLKNLPRRTLVLFFMLRT